MANQTLQMRASLAFTKENLSGNVELRDWGVVVNCASEDDALLINYHYRYNKYGSVIEPRSDGRVNLTVFNEKAKGLGIG